MSSYYEQAVAAVQTLLSPNSRVTHNEKIADKTGDLRQFDVTIKGEWCGFPALGVIECRRRSKPVDKEHVEAFFAKAESVGANFKIMVSKSGFRKNALKLAKYYNVGALSLLNGEGDAGFAIGGPSYARLYRWPKTRMAILFANPDAAAINFNPREILLGGRSVLDWWNKELSTTHLRYSASEALICELAFDRPQLAMVAGREVEIKGLLFSSTREIKKKTKFITWSGDAYCDWIDEKIIWPKDGLLEPDFVIDNRLDGHFFGDWDDYDGDIPEDNPQNFRLVMNFYQPLADPNMEVIDLTSL